MHVHLTASPLLCARTWPMPFRSVPTLLDASAAGMFYMVAQTSPLAAQTPVFPSWEGPTGLFIGGIGFAAYWIVKAVLEAKQGRASGAHSMGSDPMIWAKLQEVLDAQKVASEGLLRSTDKLNDTIKAVSDAITSHDTYVREHVSERGPMIAQAVGSSIAPLVVNAIRGAFEDNRQRTMARQVTQPTKKATTRKKKATR